MIAKLDYINSPAHCCITQPPCGALWWLRKSHIVNDANHQHSSFARRRHDVSNYIPPDRLVKVSWKSVQPFPRTVVSYLTVGKNQKSQKKQKNTCKTYTLPPHRGCVKDEKITGDNILLLGLLLLLLLCCYRPCVTRPSIFYREKPALIFWWSFICRAIASHCTYRNVTVQEIS